MAKDTEATVAEERQTADVETFDPDFEKAFDEGAKSDVDAKPREEPKLVEPIQSKEAPPSAPSAPPADPPKDPEPPKDAPPADPPKDPPADPPEPESALEKAEKAGASLEQVPAAKDAPKSVTDQLPPDYADTPQVVQTEAFQKWFDGQPQHVQNLGIKGGVDGVCAVIDRYRDHNAKVAAEAARASSPAGAKRILADLGDLEMQTADGGKTKINEYLKEYGDLGEAVAVIADALAAKRSGPAKASGEADRVARLESELAEMRFWDAVQTEHSDARKIVRSDAFQKWAKEEATPNVRRLLQSTDPQHAVLGLDAYKEVLIQKAKTGDGASAKKRTIALHADTARGKTAAVKTKNENPDDFNDGFEAGSK